MSSSDLGSVSNLIVSLKGGDANATEAIWQRFYPRVARLARKELAGRFGDRPSRVTDEDDIAVSAFDSFFKRATTGQIAALENRHQLWAILVRIVQRKAIDRSRREKSQKRGEGRVRGDSVFDLGTHEVKPAEGPFALSPGPEEEAEYTETLALLLQRLDRPELRKIVELRLGGFGVGEIADELGVARRTVERKLKLIADIWSEILD